MSNNIELHVAEEFGRAPAARYRYEGAFSGQQFLEELLLPKYLSAKEQKVKLEIYLDGALGYPSSFVSGSFGKLSIKFGAAEVLSIVKLISTNSLRVEKIIREMSNPRNK